MKMFRKLAQVVACCLMVAGFATTSFGAIEFRMQSVDNTAGPVVSADVILFWDGNGLNTISDIAVDFASPSANILIADEAVPFNPLGFQLGSINAGNPLNAALAFNNVLGGGNKTLQAGENLLTRITFDTTGAANGVYPIGLTFVSAFRGGLLDLTDISGEITLSPGTVTVVPEPSSLALLGLVSVGGFCFRRRR